MNARFDVCVVGGGPAGLFAALTLAHENLDVLVVEKKSYPIDKACGEGIMPTGAALLKEYGVLDLVDQNAMSPFVGIRYVSKTLQAVGNFSSGCGYGIRRLVLISALHEAVNQAPNITLWTNTALAEIRRKNELIEIHTTQGMADAKLLVAADGIKSKTRALLGIKAKSASTQRYGVRQHFSIRPWTNVVEVHFLPGLEAYVTPCGPNQIGIALLWEKRKINLDKKGSDLFNTLIEYFPALKARVQNAEPLSTPRSYGPFYVVPESVIANGVALVGDASYSLDPITGDGLSLAFREANALAKLLGPCLKQKSVMLTLEDLKPYATAHQKIIKNYRLLVHMALTCSRIPTLTPLLIRLFRRYPTLFSHLLDVNTGQKRLLQLFG